MTVSTMDGLSASVEHSSCNQEFTMNLISNASMDTFPENTLSSFTTLLPTPIHLSGEWQVALLEIAWPNIIQNVTVGEFTVYKRNIQSPVEKRPRKHNRPGAISMAIPAAFERQSPSTLLFYTAPVKHRLKPGCYTSVDSILASITKIAMGEEQIRRKRISSSPDNVLSLLSWKVDNVTRKLHVKFCGNHKQYGLRIFTESNDLRNILGTNVIIDCGESQKEAVEEIDTESASNTILLEIAWPNIIQNVTVGEFTVYKRNIQSPVEKRPRKHNRPGAISMAIPAAFERQSPSTLLFYTAPVKHRLKPGCYTSVDSILASITKIAMGEEQIGRKRISSSPDNVLSLLSWKVDNVTRKLHVKFCGNHKQYGLRIFTESNDLRNILGTNVIIDCGESQKEAVEEIDTESASNTIVKHVGKWPVDLNAGSHTMFLYCDLVQNQTLGDKQTALLRSIPVKSLALVQTLGEMNHKSFSNLQWKRVIKSQFQSINVTLANEMGQKIPFLSCGRTNVTLAFRPTPRH